MSKIETNTIAPSTGTTLTLGENGDTVTLGTGATQSGFGGNNKPLFYAYRNSEQSISVNTDTKVQFNTEDFDADSVYDNSTNYRFTVPSGEAGKYFVYAKLVARSTSNNTDLNRIMIYKNGSLFSRFSMNADGTSNAQFREFPHSISAIMDLSVGDYVEIYGRMGGSQASGLSFLGSSNRDTVFTAYKIIT